ncbi:MAG: thioredoxin domain-containing protein [Pseudomonadota bacterium]
MLRRAEDTVCASNWRTPFKRARTYRGALSSALTSSGFLLSFFAAPLYANHGDDEFGVKVREYLLAHPEVILEVMDVLSERQEELRTTALLEPHLETLFDTEDDLRIGSNDASTVIVEFFDYNCAACRANMPVLRAFVAANPEVTILKKHLPVLSPSSERATRFVLAARLLFGDRAYQSLHKALYAKQQIMSMAKLTELAKGLNLDAQQIQSEMQNSEISAIIETHRDMAVALGIVGTPTFVTDRAIVAGNVTPAILAKLSAAD